MCKQRAIVFHGGRVIVNFVPKFVAIATGEDNGGRQGRNLSDTIG